ncbi:MAG: Proteasome subunit beta, bacterial, partial [uncultured Nocardioidaceae bacterium]
EHHGWSAAAGGVPHAGVVLVHRLPRGPGPRAAAVAAHAAVGRPVRTRTPRHHDRRSDLPRGSGDGRRPAGDDGQHHRPARHRESVPRGRVLVRRHRRHRGAGGRDGPPLPARAGALREDRGQPALDGRQGQPARDADPVEPRHGHAGARGRAAVRRLRPHLAARPDLLLRRHRWPLRGDRVPLGRLRLAVRPRGAEEALPRGPRRGGRGHRARPGAVRRRRRRLGHRRTRHDPADLPGRRGHHRAGLPTAARRRGGCHRRPRHRSPDATPRRSRRPAHL